MASPSLPGSSPGILTGTGRARKSSFTSAAGFPGDDSDDEDSSFTSQVTCETHGSIPLCEGRRVAG